MGTRAWCVTICLLILSGCGSSVSLTTLSDAEQFGKSRGLSLVKVNDYKATVPHVSAAANYTAGEVKLHVLQFETTSDATNWLDGVRALNMAGDIIQHGPIVFAIDRGPDADVARVKDELR